MSTLSIAAILLYLAFIVYVAWKSSRYETRESFMLADRSLNWGQIAMSMTAGWTSGAVAIGAAAFAYEGAGIMVAFSISVVISMLFMAFFAPRIRQIAREENVYTLPGMMRRKFGRIPQMASGAITAVIYMIFLLMEFIVGGTLFAALSGWSYPVCVGLIGFTILAYLMIGGFSVMIKTDVLQFVLIGILAFLFVFVADYSKLPGSPVAETFKSFEGMPFMVTLGLVLAVLPAQLTPADLWQRIYAARSDRDAFWGIFIFTLVITLVLLVMTFLAVAVGMMREGVKDREIFIDALELFLHPALMPIALVAILAMLMSSMDSFLFVTGQALVNDFAARFKPKILRKPRLFSRIGIVIALLIAMPLSLLKPNIADLFYFVVYLFIAMLPAVYAFTIRKPPSGSGVGVTMIVSALVLTGMYLTGTLTDWRAVGVIVFALAFPFIYDVARKTVTPRPNA